MQIFACPTCSRAVYFDNTRCRCGQSVVFDPDSQSMRIDGASCGNREQIACNWIAEEAGLCRSCNLTETVPDLGAEENIELWARTEAAKRWMLANLARWGWFTPRDPGDRPQFKLLSEQTAAGEADVVMGHANGLITINVTEASESMRAERQETLGELYRTMLGHMRHEMAHFLHLRLSANPQFLSEFRNLFGDEREDYGEALKRHYADPGVPGQTHITSYATAHAHEDWAETTAHLLHLVDLLDSVVATRLSLPEGPRPGYDTYREEDVEHIITLAVDTALAINHVNRAMDLTDLYPFVLTQTVREKLAFVHKWLHNPAAHTGT
ncbi:zinc-binding metallopeptidase family protein [Roseibium sp.]|uniref:zinc-binding metallopeptidase family protein n=1 Tax=Roseibium sp. TaxID=1936156 RepID=UPI003A96D7B1